MSVLRLFAFLLLLTPFTAAQDLKVAAAADLTPALQKLSPAFEKETGIHLSIALGSSGNFFAQIQNGAPFDVFLSADKSYPEKLQQAGLTEPGTLAAYARGRLVLWTPSNSPLRFSAKNGTLTGDLKPLTASAGKIAIANPAHAPYGRAAAAVLQHYGIYDQVKPRLVLGENISQTAQFAESGDVGAAFLAMAIAVTPEMKQKGSFIVLPQESYPPLDQAAVILHSSQRKAQARRFLEFLRSPQARKILGDFGFEAPTT
ncbi:MAG: molybdate ABC transporter substrate-binding protein [Actinomycetota bacterium]